MGFIRFCFGHVNLHTPPCAESLSESAAVQGKTKVLLSARLNTFCFVLSSDWSRLTIPRSEPNSNTTSFLQIWGMFFCALCSQIANLKLAAYTMIVKEEYTNREWGTQCDLTLNLWGYDLHTSNCDLELNINHTATDSSCEWVARYVQIIFGKIKN
jgi:hypothetical protein